MILDLHKVTKEMEKMGFSVYAYSKYYKYFYINNKKYKVILIFKKNVVKQELTLIDTKIQREIFKEFFIDTTNIPQKFRYEIMKYIDKLEKKCKKEVN